jgi:hypothetical protein
MTVRLVNTQGVTRFEQVLEPEWCGHSRGTTCLVTPI